MVRELRRNIGERLLAELWASARDDREALLREERFQSPELLDLLLEECHAALPSDPARGAAIVGMATILCQSFEPGELEALETKGQIFGLGGTVRRLLGDHRGAEAFFEQAAFLDVKSAGPRGFLCRGLGLLRWDQGRFDEAAALLLHAAQQFQREGCMPEQSASLALAGLLAVERIAFFEAQGLLDTALQSLDAQRRPWLACWATLGRALSLLAGGYSAEAQSARERAWRLYADIPDEEVLAGLHWLEGRVALGLSDTADAMHLLDAVRRNFLTARRLPEATLATIDVGQALVESGRGGEMPPLVAELALAFEGRPKLETAIVPLITFAFEAEASTPGRNLWFCAGSALRRLFRAEGIFFQPVPFA